MKGSSVYQQLVILRMQGPFPAANLGGGKIRIPLGGLQQNSSHAVPAAPVGGGKLRIPFGDLQRNPSYAGPLPAAPLGGGKLRIPFGGL
jgi:hypothetical protein